MRTILVLACVTAAFGADATDWPTGNRTTPPIINSVSPLGVARGATVEMDIDGLNLANASAVYFSVPGIKARILRIKELPDLSDIRLGSNGTLSTVDLGPLPPRNQVTVELEVSPDVPVGPVGFRLQTPLGTSPERRFVVEPYYGETPDREPNDVPDQAFETYLPTILVGAISKPGDLDYYKIQVKAGEQLVFDNPARMLGSSLQPVLGIYDAGQNLVKEFGQDGGRDAKWYAYRFDSAGTYYLRVSDYENSGNAGHFYRIKAGQFPLAISAFPLGLEQGKEATISLRGYNLGSGNLQVNGQPTPRYDALVVRPKAPSGYAFNEIKLALGHEPEVLCSGANTSPASAQPITLPVTINGKMLAGENDFRFKARKGEKLVFAVEAARFGSLLDSQLEVLDTNAKPVERGDGALYPGNLNDTQRP